MALFGIFVFFCVSFARAHDDDLLIDCELYLAPSTIPNAGLGLFNGPNAKSLNDSIASEDIALPLVDFVWNNYDGARLFHSLGEYVWMGSVMGMGLERNTTDLDAYWPGLNSLVNCHLPLVNLQRSYPSYNLMGLHPTRDYNAGAITPYRSGGPTKLKHPIPPGGEIFKSYGDAWFQNRKRMFGNIPLSKDYPKSNLLLRKLARFIKQPRDRKIILALIRDLNKDWDSRVLNAIPENDDDVELAISKGIGGALQLKATRSIGWLQQNGKCVDHIAPAPSAIPGVGEGAFARRRLPKGALVSSSPLVHYPHFKAMEMHNRVKKKGNKPTLNDPKAGVFSQQIVLNYCMGHSNTTLLLCPYGPGINYLNHNREHANVRMQWADHGVTGHDANWLYKAPEDMYNDPRPHLAVDYIATRDIAKGEELFLDYGDDWIAAWDRHVKSWTPSTSTMFDDVNASERFITVGDKSNYPDSVQIRCHYQLSDFHWEKRWKAGEITWHRVGPDVTPKVHTWYGHACDIVERSDKDNTYTVRMRQDRLSYFYDPDTGYGESPLRYRVPREAIFFAAEEDTSHLYVPGVFRHTIGLPDEMLPNAWKNNVQQDDKKNQQEPSSGVYRTT